MPRILACTGQRLTPKRKFSDDFGGDPFENAAASTAAKLAKTLAAEAAMEAVATEAVAASKIAAKAESQLMGMMVMGGEKRRWIQGVNSVTTASNIRRLEITPSQHQPDGWKKGVPTNMRREHQHDSGEFGWPQCPKACMAEEMAAVTGAAEATAQTRLPTIGEGDRLEKREWQQWNQTEPRGESQVIDWSSLKEPHPQFGISIFDIAQGYVLKIYKVRHHVDRADASHG